MGNENVVTLRIAAEDAFTSTMNQAAQAFALLGKEALANISKIQKAFKDLNLKSSLDIEVEKAKLLEAFNQIKFSGVASADEIKRAQVAYHAEMEKLDKQLRVVSQSSNDVDTSQKKLGGTFLNLKDMVGGLVAGLAAFSLADLARQSVEAAVKMQALEVQFKTISGSSELAGQNLQFVSAESQRLGLVFTDTADAFAKFSASAKGTAIEGQGVKNVFAGVTEAVTALHLPADAAQRIFYQLSQMMSKNKVTAEDLNVVAESMPGTYAALAQSLGLTTSELQQQMTAGTLLASEVLPKLGEQLHKTYGAAAVEGAKSAQAEFNRFKNAVFELSASFGQTLMPMLTVLMNVLTGVGATIKWVIDLLGPGAPVAAAFAVVIGVLTAAYKLLTAEVIASTAAFLVNPLFLLVAAGAAAVLGIAAAIKAIAEAIGLTGDASEKSAEATAKDLKAKEEKAAKEKKILDDYEKALGISLDRQLAREKQTYEEGILAVYAKYDAEIAAAGNNAAEVKRLEEAKAKDLETLYQKHLTARQDMRDKDTEAERKFYADSLKTGIEYYKVIGNQTSQDVNEYKLKLAKKIEAVEKYYAMEIDKAQGNLLAIVALEDAKQKDISALKQKAAEDHVLIGLERQKRELENEKQATTEQIQEIKRKVAEHVISEQAGQTQILEIEKATAQKIYENRLYYAEQTKKTYGAQSDEYKAALKEQEAAYTAYIGKSIDLTKNAEAQRKQEWDINAASYKNVLDRELAYIQEYCANGTLSHREAAIQRLQAETDYFEKVKLLRAQELATLNPETQALEYQKALSAKIAADRQYESSYTALLRAREKETADAELAITERHKEEIERRKAADQAAREQQRAFVSSWFALWDKAYNDGAASLSKLSDAAYNVFAAMNNLPLKVTETVDSLRAAAAKAKAEVIEMTKAADLAGAFAGGSWGQAFRNLQMISVQAKKVTADFLDQKAAALTLGEALQDPVNQTLEFVNNAQLAIRNMKLLDQSTLDKVKGEIDKIKNAMISFTEKVIAGLKSLQDEWDNMSMSKLELEEKRYQEQRAQWEKDYAAAVAQGNAEAIRALREQLDLIDKIHQKKVADINTESSTVPKMATGGIVGGSGIGDTQLRLLDPREHVIRPEATAFWGHGLLAAINAPWTSAGKAIAARLASMEMPYIPSVPRFAMATGGEVGVLAPQNSGAAGGGGNLTVQIFPQRLDETTVRREVIPVIEKFYKGKA